MKRTQCITGAFAAALTATVFAAPAMAGSLSLADHGYFFAGGNYVPSGGDKILDGPAYVEYFIPSKKTQKYPVVMIHGGGQTGTNFLKTPDGRDGWADYFIRAGYATYVIDQPVRGRSVVHPAIDGATSGSTALQIQQRFTAPELYPPGVQQGWPQSKLHTQWPGSGVAGDPTFDQFFASQVESAGNPEGYNKDAVPKLLDKIGPAIIMTHSQSGAIGWQIADARPKLVKAILAAEPSGPPFDNAVAPWGAGNINARPYGITANPITYDPPITSGSQLNVVVDPSPDPANLVSCKRQAEPARKLATLRNIPVLVFQSEASYHAGYDYCTVKYLKQAGVKVDYKRLADVGIHGNGHMIMLEKNNERTAKFMLDWLADNVKGSHENDLGQDCGPSHNETCY